jgi:hypothetical protein
MLRWALQLLEVSGGSSDGLRRRRGSWVVVFDVRFHEIGAAGSGVAAALAADIAIDSMAAAVAVVDVVLVDTQAALAARRDWI